MKILVSFYLNFLLAAGISFVNFGIERDTLVQMQWLCIIDCGHNFLKHPRLGSFTIFCSLNFFEILKFSSRPGISGSWPPEESVMNNFRV